MKLRWYHFGLPVLVVLLVLELACSSGSDSPPVDETDPPDDSTSSSGGEQDPPNPGSGEPTPICTVPMTKVFTYEGRDVYTADVNLEGTVNTCVLTQSTEFRAASATMQIGYLAGSPGYSIDARPDYEITSVEPGTLRPGKEAADVLEDNTITFTARRRDGADAGPDAGPNPTRRLRVHMTSDTDPAKWTLSLYAFEVMP